jgi:hypothetical protein
MTRSEERKARRLPARGIPARTRSMMALTASVLFSIGLVTDGARADVITPAADRYWMLELASAQAHDGSRVQFLRTSRISERETRVADGCDSHPQRGPVAQAREDGGWSLGAQFGNLNAVVSASGRLELSLSGKPYASGREIAAFECVQGVPKRIVPIAPPPGPAARAQDDASAITLGDEGDMDHLVAARAAMLPTQRPSFPALPPTPADTSTALDNGDTLACHSTPARLLEFRRLQDLPMLGTNAELWPGALLQGKGYAQGLFAPITIARAGGTINVSGVNFATKDKFAISASLDVMSGTEARSAIARLMSQQISSTEAQVSFKAEVVFNADQMAYAQGVDGRFLNGLDNTLRPDPASKQNYVLVRFRQTYYNASFEPPELQTSVFRDGRSFKDPENQIAADNPPLYISDVGYGRAIYFLVGSRHDGQALIQALQAANDNKSGADTLIGGISASQILRESTVSYVVQGGDAIPALDAVGGSAGVADLYEALRKTMADARLAQVTEFSRGVPVSSTVSYLVDRSNAGMGFATEYIATSCTLFKPKPYASFQLLLYGVDDSVKATLLDSSNQSTLVYEGSGPPRYFDLDAFIPEARKDESFVLRLEVYNIAGPSGLNFLLSRRDRVEGQTRLMALQSDGRGLVPYQPVNPRIYPPPLPSPMVSTGGSWSVGWIVDYRVRINRSTGEMTVIQGN